MTEVDDHNAELSRRERKKLAVHHRIRRAASTLFAQKGYDATTIDEIAEMADVAKGTFFNYFPRKDALLADLGEELWQEVLEEVGPLESWDGNVREYLTLLLVTLGERVQQNPQLFKVMLIESMRNFWLRQEEDQGQQAFRDLIRLLLKEAKARGEFPADLDVVVGMKMIHAVYVTTTFESLKRTIPRAEFRGGLVTKMNILFRGLGAEPVAESRVSR